MSSRDARLLLVLLCFSLSMVSAAPAQTRSGGDLYGEDWDSLSRHPVPEWFQDAKFGIYAHWGVYSVPAFENEWYPRKMYLDGHRVQKFHEDKYGDPSEFGYKDFVPMFRAEKFDAEEWADLYEKAGAKFAGPVAEHHDGFSMWKSEVNRWNAADMGPRRDITAELAAALRKRGIKLIASFHHAFNIQGYYTAKEGWDTADPEFGDLYGKFEDPKVAHDRWLAKIIEVIDRYQPDQIWFDFGLAKIPDEYKRRMAAYYYNKEAEWGKPVIITRKGEHLPKGVGVLDIERGKMEGPADFLWQTDDSVAINSWCWVYDLNLKPARELVHELIDIVSKNGVLLLNVCPKADGTIPGDQRRLLLEMGDWLKVNGEAIYGTRPWKIHGEGPNLFDKGRGFHRDAMKFDAADIRFTRKGDVLYAIALGWPEEPMTLEGIQVDEVRPDASLTLLGYAMPLRFFVSDEDRRMTIYPPELSPEQRPCRHAFTFKLFGMNLSVHPEAKFTLGKAITLAADKAVLEGGRIKLEETIAGRPNIGFWDNPKDRVHWLVKVERAGNYAVRGEFAAAAGASRLVVEVAGQKSAFDIPETSGWDKAVIVDMGRLAFDEPGVFHLVLRPADSGQWKPVNVWRIQLALEM